MFAADEAAEEDAAEERAARALVSFASLSRARLAYMLGWRWTLWMEVAWGRACRAEETEGKAIRFDGVGLDVIASAVLLVVVMWVGVRAMTATARR